MAPKTRVNEFPDREEPPPGNDSVNELHVKVLHQRKIYMDDTGRFPTRSRTSNQYVMVAYHLLNVIFLNLLHLERTNIVCQHTMS